MRAKNAILKSLASIFAFTSVMQGGICSIHAEEAFPEDYIDDAVVQEDTKIEPDQIGTVILENQISKDNEFKGAINNLYEYKISTDQKMDPDVDWEYVIDDGQIGCTRFTEFKKTQK